MCITILTS